MEYRRLTLLIVLYLARGTGISRGLNALLIERVENTDSSDVFFPSPLQQKLLIGPKRKNEHTNNIKLQGKHFN